jgi:PAS domain S-box-containing protein
MFTGGGGYRGILGIAGLLAEKCPLAKRRLCVTRDLILNAGFLILFRSVSSDSDTTDSSSSLLRRAAEALEKSHRRTRLYEAVLSSTPDLIYIFDLDHRFIYANQALLKMWGRTWDEAIGRNCLELGYEAWHAAMHDREIEQAVATKQPVRGEVPFIGTAGRRIYDYIFVPVIGADGSVEAVAGTTRDVTDRKAAEEQLAAAKAAADAGSKAKDDFLAALSHELRTPLNPVLLVAVEGERNPDLPPSVRADFAAIRRNVELEARLIDDLLDLTRISHGKLRLERQVLDAHELLHACVGFVQPEIEAQGLRLTVALGAAEHWVEADPVRLQQVFWNVLRNAVKFSLSGGDVALRTANRDGRLQVEITDTGVGIAPVDLPKIFDAFQQGTQGDLFGGLGLGLAITRALVEQHGGCITAESPGRGLGTTFRLEFPLANRPFSRATTNGEGTGGSEPVKQVARRILLVEDHVDTRETMARLLVRRGHQVSPAGTLRAARALAASCEFDVVISDLGLPDGEGTELLAAFANAARKPLSIAMTGFGMEDDIQRTLAAGFAAHLTKPINMADLDRVLCKY